MTASTSTFNFRGAALAVAFGFLAMSGAAQAQQPTPAAIEVARQIVLVKGGTTFDPVIPGVIETAKNMFLPTNPNLAKDLNEVAAQLRKEFYETKRAELLTEVAKAYASRFTEPELKDILAFYKTPLGQKLIAEEPRATEASMRRAQDWANNFSEEVITRMREEMRKRGANL